MLGKTERKKLNFKLNVRNMDADVVAEFMKHFKNLEKHWQRHVDAGNSLREHECQLKRVSRSLVYKKWKQEALLLEANPKMTEQAGKLPAFSKEGRGPSWT